MSHHKMTTISAWKPGAPELTAPIGTDERRAQINARLAFYFVSVVNGHWPPQSAFNLARRAGCTGPVEVTHFTADLSGHGAGGYDKAFIVTGQGVTERTLSRAEREYGDGDDVNAIYDEIEGRG
jgi:hypothetical protein